MYQACEACNALVIPKQAILCSLLASALLVLNLTADHHAVAGLVTMSFTTAVYIQYTAFDFSPHVSPNVLLHVRKAL